MRINYRKGFTLIELLVVISIISLLSSVILASLNDAKMKARDTQRIRTLVELRTALEMYANDHNGEYPSCNAGNNYCRSTTESGPAGGDLSLLSQMSSYIKNITRDPINIDGQYGYYYLKGCKPTTVNNYICPGGENNYILGTRLERSSNPLVNKTANGAFGNNTPLNFLIGQ
jgi:prepilin-type N-terminal cleavage/methylation domain-containing protein